MLAHLSIRNIALIERLELALDRGLTVFTGETGAGKSITFDALAILLGARANTELIRTGAEEAVVQAVFSLQGDAFAHAERVLTQAGLPVEGDLIIRRSVNRRGPNRVFVNDTLATVGILSTLLEPLIDLVGQHQHLSLTRAAMHRDLIDAFGDYSPELDKMRAEYDTWRAARRALSELEGARAQRAERVDFLKYQIKELEALAPQDGEMEVLEARLRRARDGEKLRAAMATTIGALSQGRASARDQLGVALEALGRATRLDDSLQTLTVRLEGIAVDIDDVAHEIARYTTSLDDDADLDALEGRHEQLRRAIRKYGLDEAALVARLDAAREELLTLENFEDRMLTAERDEADAHARAVAQAKQLRSLREGAAAVLFSKTQDTLGALGMPHTRLELRLADTSATLGARGFDDVEILFSANPGEALGPVGRIASGGELSRLMLALKTSMAAADPVDTYVFDEVDTGVGGATADTLGRLLRELSGDRQVLCITHLPQIARFGAAHYQVSKHVEQERTYSRITSLSGDARVEEIARMMGGAELGSSTLSHARELIQATEVDARNAIR